MGIEIRIFLTVVGIGILLMVFLQIGSDVLDAIPCQEYNGTCKYYKCISDSSIRLNMIQAYELRYQNCLIKEALDKGVPVTIIGTEVIE